MASHEPTLDTLETKKEYTGKKLRIGIVGAGGIASIHVSRYKDVPAAEIVAVCDIDENRLEPFAKRFNIPKTYNSIEEMIANEELDAVDVCVWNCNHAKCSIYALEHGLNVLCEKPMAYNTEEAIKMKEAADKSGKLLMIGFVLHFADDTKLVQDFKEDLGEIDYSKATYLRRHGAPGGWFCDKARSGGGPIIDLGVHVIDQTRMLMGRPKPVSVYAASSDKIGFRPNLVNKPGWFPHVSKFDNGVTDVEDFGTALIRYDNGAVTLLETSYSLNGETNNAKALYGTKGGVVIGNDIKIYTEMHNRLVDITPSHEGIRTNDHFLKEMEHFVDCCLNGTECIATAEDGIWVMKILDAIYESAKTGHEVEIK